MQIRSGKYAGKSSEQVVLKFPDYVEWYIGAYPTAKLSTEFKRLVGIFDRKPLRTKCYTCKKSATLATAYMNNPSLYFWCSDCDYYGSGANKGKLTIIKTYSNALQHIELNCGGYKSWKSTIIKSLAQAKGLPARVGDAQAVAFF